MNIAIEARHLSTDLARKLFLLSKLAGMAKEWALGKLIADATCLLTMATMMADLRLVIEPPQDESVERSAFLSLKQGRMSMLERAEHIVSFVTTHPADMATQVHVLNSEVAAAVVLREEYSVTASQAFDVSRAPVSEQEPMEADAIRHYGGCQVGVIDSSNNIAIDAQSASDAVHPLW
ncbi:hypothetical protein ON010_g6777 [Phytophthora cinnamomi]|nr:hypothetical protein ON010_g6777 [Phytophthora cinnamomi]